MSLLDKASLIVTPNAYKESKLYSVIPTSGAGDMNVVRATTATRKNSAGLIEVVPRNLAQYSEQFDNAYWVKNAVTITPNAIAAPNGIISADKLVENTSNTLHYLNLPASTTPQGTNTISVYAKAAGRDWIWLYFFDGVLGSLTAYFNISNGTLGTVQSGLTANILSVGNGWYRCSITRTQANAGNGGFGLGTANNVQSYLGNGTSGAYVWGAQLEVGSTATEYFPTTNRLNIPRIDYTNGSCPSLLVEPQRTNILLYSQNFNGASWGKTATTINANAGISPDGTNNANKFIPSTAATSHYIAQGFISSSNGSISIYAKADGYNNITLLTINTNINYNLSTGTVQATGGVGTGAIQSVGNGWYRCILYKVLTTETIYISCGSNTNAGFFNGSGNGTSGVLIWGAQVEVGTYPTSYIPTVASSVTRNMDIISKTGISSLIGQTEGTAFIECTADTTNSNGAMLIYLGSSDGSGAFNYSTYLKFSSTSLNLAVYSGGTSYVDSTSSQTYTNKQNIKVAIAYKNNDFVCYANGVQLFTDTTGVVSTNLSSLSLGHYPPNIPYNQYNGNIKSAQLYKTRLTNTELAQLTTI